MLNSYINGQLAESIALKYLQQRNLLLLNKNFRSRFGEIDLIMRDKDSIIFVEVRQRSNGVNSAIASISPSKQRKLIKAAQYYLVKTGYDIACRFDVIAMDNKNNIIWLKNVICL